VKDCVCVLCVLLRRRCDCYTAFPRNVHSSCCLCRQPSQSHVHDSLSSSNWKWKWAQPKSASPPLSILRASDKKNSFDLRTLFSTTRTSLEWGFLSFVVAMISCFSSHFPCFRRMYKYHFVTKCFDIDSIMDDMDNNFLNAVFASPLSAFSTPSSQKQSIWAPYQGPQLSAPSLQQF